MKKSAFFGGLQKKNKKKTNKCHGQLSNPTVKSFILSLTQTKLEAYKKNIRASGNPTDRAKSVFCHIFCQKKPVNWIVYMFSYYFTFYFSYFVWLSIESRLTVIIL